MYTLYNLNVENTGILNKLGCNIKLVTVYRYVDVVRIISKLSRLERISCVSHLRPVLAVGNLVNRIQVHIEQIPVID